LKVVHVAVRWISQGRTKARKSQPLSGDAA